MQALHVLLSFFYNIYLIPFLSLFKMYFVQYCEVFSGEECSWSAHGHVGMFKRHVVSNLHRRDLAVRYAAGSVRLSCSLRLG